MKLTMSDLTRIVLDYELKKSRGFFSYYLPDQSPVAKLKNHLQSDHDLSPFEHIRVFFSLPINPRSDSFKILHQCLALDGVDAAELYSTLILLENAHLLDEAMYDALVPHRNKGQLIDIIECVSLGNVLTPKVLIHILTTDRLDLFITVYKKLARLQIADQASIEHACIAADPMAYATALRWLLHHDLFSPENKAYLAQHSNLPELTTAMKLLEMDGLRIDSEHFFAIKNSKHPSFNASMVKTLYVKKILQERHTKAIASFIEPKAICYILKIILEKNDLMSLANVDLLFTTPELQSKELHRILKKYPIAAWTQTMFEAFLVKAQKKNALSHVEAYLEKHWDVDMQQVTDSILIEQGSDNSIELTDLSHFKTMHS